MLGPQHESEKHPLLSLTARQSVCRGLETFVPTRLDRSAFLGSFLQAGGLARAEAQAMGECLLTTHCRRSKQNSVPPSGVLESDPLR